MTVVAWDGKTLAADKRATYGTAHRTVTKIFDMGDCLVGIAGSATHAMRIIEWVREGCDTETFPVVRDGSSDYAVVLLVFRDGTIAEYDEGPFPILYEDKRAAIGSGADFAMAAMHCGKNATEAVEIAALYDVGCGNGITSLTFSPEVVEEEPFNFSQPYRGLVRG